MCTVVLLGVGVGMGARFAPTRVVCSLVGLPLRVLRVRFLVFNVYFIFRIGYLFLRVFEKSMKSHILTLYLCVFLGLHAPILKPNLDLTLR